MNNFQDKLIQSIYLKKLVTVSIFDYYDPMFDYLKGVITHIDLESVTLDIEGIGYKIYTPVKDLPPLQSNATFYTHLIFRDPLFTLFGFLTRSDREIFETLLSVSGVGPKTALNLLSHLTLATLQTAILSQNITTLSSVPGIGKKTAERLLLELKTKLTHLQPMHDPAPNHFNDALTALINLGYSPNVAQKALSDTYKALPANTNLSNLISATLKVIK